MVAAIKYNLRHLMDFTGRDARQTFWYYLLFIVVLQFVFGMIAVIPSMVSIMSGAFEIASSGGGEAEMQAAMAQDIASMLTQQVWISAAASVICCALFAAAFVRRLHDAGFTGWIAVIPIATTLFSVWQSISMIDEMIAVAQATMVNADPDSAMTMQQDMSLASAVGWLGYLLVIGFGVIKSQDGPNKYGEAPVRF